MRRASLIAIAVLVAAAAVGGWLWTRRAREAPLPPEQELYSSAIPVWMIAKFRNDLPSGPFLRVEQLAAKWPRLLERLRAIDAAFPDVEKFTAAVAALNDAARAERLEYWLDVQVVRNQPVVLSYRVEQRSGWSLGERSVEVLRVRRVDPLNVVMGLTGQAGPDRPVVILDRLEPQVVRDTLEAWPGKNAEPDPDENDVDLAARARWRAVMERATGAEAFALSAAQLHRREELFATMRARLHEGTVSLGEPEGFAIGEAWFDKLLPFTDVRRRGGPLLLKADLRDLRKADEALRGGPGRAALEAALDLEAHAVEAHEARHALDPDALPVPQRLLELVGDDDAEFAGMAERELRAYFGELIDSKAPACLTLLRLAGHVAGSRARANPHHYGGTLLLEQLGATPETVAEVLRAQCDRSDAEVRQDAAAAYERVYGQAFRKAVRAESPAAVAVGAP